MQVITLITFKVFSSSYNRPQQNLLNYHGMASRRAAIKHVAQSYSNNKNMSHQPLLDIMTIKSTSSTYQPILIFHTILENNQLHLGV